MQHSNTDHLPAQHTQNQVENEEGSKDDQADKVDPRQLEAHRIIHLKRNTEQDEDISLLMKSVGRFKTNHITADDRNISAFLEQQKTDLRK